MSENLTRDLPPEGVELILASLRSIDTRLTSLAELVDRRLDETRAIWQKILSRLDAIEIRVGGIDDKRPERQMAQLASDIMAMRADQNDLERRMVRLEDKLEMKPAP